jgi:RNA polymerase sigma factor (sigma-70 family)
MSVRVPPFQAFFDAHRGEVYRLLVAGVGRQEADDCFQETFLAALRAYPRLRDASNLRAWVLTIAARKALDHHRARKRGPEPLADVPDEPGDPPAPRDEALWEDVRRLPPKQRGAILLRVVSDLPYREVGRALGCSEEAARANVHEGLMRLRQRWTRSRKD